MEWTWLISLLAIFAKVVEAKGFSEAARRLKMPLSTVSRRVAELEVGVGRARP
jgi:DNA-binding transcriptional LysR family regulator